MALAALKTDQTAAELAQQENIQPNHGPEAAIDGVCGAGVS